MLEATVLGLGEGSREAFMEKVEALDGERPSPVALPLGPSLLDWSVSVDCRLL